jgi:hypothetical protein
MPETELRDDLKQTLSATDECISRVACPPCSKCEKETTDLKRQLKIEEHAGARTPTSLHSRLKVLLILGRKSVALVTRNFFLQLQKHQL